MLKLNFPFIGGDNNDMDDDVKNSNEQNDETNLDSLNSDSDETESEKETDESDEKPKLNEEKLKLQDNSKKNKNEKTEKQVKKIESKIQFKPKKKNKTRKLNKQTIHLIENYQSSKIKNISRLILNVLSSTAQYSIIVGASTFISYSLVGSSNNFFSNVLRDAIFSSTRIISDICTTTKNNYFQQPINKGNETKPLSYEVHDTILNTEKNYIESIFAVDWFTLNK